MRVLLDNNLSPRLARSLDALLEPEDEVVHLIDRFPRDTEDRLWIGRLAEEGGWVVISADQRIYRNPLEREAWRRSRLIAFFLAPQWARANNIEAAPAAFELPLNYGSGRLRVLRG